MMQLLDASALKIGIQLQSTIHHHGARELTSASLAAARGQRPNTTKRKKPQQTSDTALCQQERQQQRRDEADCRLLFECFPSPFLLQPYNFFPFLGLSVLFVNVSESVSDPPPFAQPKDSRARRWRKSHHSARSDWQVQSWPDWGCQERHC